MSGSVSEANWKKLIEILGLAMVHLDGHNHPALVEVFSRFVQATESLGLEDLAAVGRKLLRFTVQVIPVEWEEEAGGTLGFTLGGVVEKMEKEAYGPKFAAELDEVLIFLDMFYEDKGLSSEDVPEPSVEEIPDEALAPETETEVVSAPTSLGEAEPPNFEEAVAPPRAESRVDLSFEPPPTEPAAKESPESAQDWADDLFESLLTEVEAAPKPAQAAPAQAVKASPQEPAATQDWADDLFATLQAAEEPDAAPPVPQPATAMEPSPESLPKPSQEAAPDLPTDPVDMFRLFLLYDPRSAVFVRLGELLCSRREWAEAAKVLEKGLASHPDHLRARVLLGWARYELGDLRQAEALLGSVEKEFRENTLAFEILADMADSRGDSTASGRYRALARSFDTSVAATQASPGASIEARPAPAAALSPQAEEIPLPQPAKPPVQTVGTDLDSVIAILDGLADALNGRPAAPRSSLFSKEDRDILGSWLTQ